MAALPDEQVRDLLRDASLIPLAQKTITDKNEVWNRILEARQVGYAWNDQELEEGLISTAVPVHRRDGTVAASLNTNYIATKASQPKYLDGILPSLRRTAVSIGRLLN